MFGIGSKKGKDRSSTSSTSPPTPAKSASSASVPPPASVISSGNLKASVGSLPSSARDIHVLVIGEETVDTQLFFRSLMKTHAPNNPECFNPLTIVHRDMKRNVDYLLRFHLLQLKRNSDKTFEPITWKPYYDKLQLVIYMVDATKFPDDRLLQESLQAFKFVLQSGFFYEESNTYANLPMMIFLDRGPSISDPLEKNVGMIVESYKRSYTQEDNGTDLYFHFDSLDEPGTLQSIIAVIDVVIASTDVTDLLTLTFNPHKKKNVKELISNKQPRFNRMNPNFVEGRVAVEKLKSISPFVKCLTSNSYIITELNLRNNSLKKQIVQELLQAVHYNKTLRMLNLSHNLIGDECMGYFVDMLRVNTALKVLILIKNDIGDAGITTLASAFENNTTLEFLDVSENLIKSQGCDNLTAQLQSNLSLRGLSLWLNKVGPEGMNAIAELLRWNTALTYLDVTDVDATESDLQKWITALQLAKNSSLTTFSYSFVNIESDKEIQVILSKNLQRSNRRTVDPPIANTTHLDLCGGGLDTLPKEWTTFLQNVSEINMSHNKLIAIPATFFGYNNLTCLVMSSNNISGRLTTHISRLQSLTHLDLAGNLITAIPPEISSLHQLEVLDLRWNKITTAGFPPQIYSMTQLVHLNLQNNALTTISDEIFKMTKLKNLLLTGNMIQIIRQRILSAWSSRSSYLDLSGMPELVAIPREIGYLSNLEVLDLHNNKLIALPLEIGDLSKLHTLDVSDNQLDNLPWTLGQLPSLTKLNIANNPFSKIPSETLGRDTVFLKNWLLSLKSGYVACKRMKLMLVGQENVGKTSLSRCFKEMSAKGAKKMSKKSPNTISTDGIDIEDWEPIDPTAAPNEDKESRLRFNIWDFGGQEVYYNTHQFFLNKRSLFLICFNLVDGSEMPRVDYWLQSINLRTPDAPVILVGTHLDSSKCTKKYLTDLETYVQTTYKKRFPQLKCFIQVSCKTKKNIDILTGEILKVAKSQKVENFPRSYLQLEDIVVAERSLHLPPIISLAEFKKMVSGCGIPTESAQSVAEFLGDLGSLIYFNDPRSGLDDLLILDPQWLTSLLATLITTKKNFVKNGILIFSDLIHIWYPPRFPAHLHERILVLFEHFGVSHQLGTGPNSKILIPCLLDATKPSDWDSTWKNILVKNTKTFERKFKFQFLPLGFFAKVMSGVLEFTYPDCFYKNGFITSTRSHEYLLIEFDPTKVELSLRVCGVVAPVNLLRLIVDSLHGLIKNWYSVTFQEAVPCKCGGHDLPIKDLENALSQGGQSYITCKANKIPIDELAPDLTLADFEEYMIDYSKLTFKKELGKGSFGTVALADYQNKLVAVKTLILPPMHNVTEILRDFRRELWIGSSFKHENIVSMIGCCSSPQFCLIMEYIPFGNVYDFLRSKIGVTWPIRLKIALDIAGGMSFLHGMEPKMMHRDLKTPNVLLASMDPESAIMAKLTDFGETRGMLVKMKGREGLANPSWLAPEIMTDETYTEKADVFSFGIVLWELYRRQHPYTEYPICHSKYAYQLEDAIVKGLRPSFPKECHPGFVKLAAQCMAGPPAERPTFPTILSELSRLKKELSGNKEVVMYDPTLYAAIIAQSQNQNEKKSTKPGTNTQENPATSTDTAP